VPLPVLLFLLDYFLLDVVLKKILEKMKSLV